MDERCLVVRDLCVEFGHEGAAFRAIEGVSFDLFRGKTLAIVGESGSGKSVTANAVMGLLPRAGRIAGGSILFVDHAHAARTIVDIAALARDGEEIRALRGARIAMIFQEPMTSLSPLHTIGDQIGEALMLHAGASRAAADERTVELLTRVGFRDPRGALATYPFELSGGMRQRAMIAMALVCNPAILVADEPTTALDVTTQAQILQLIKDLQREFSTAVILITHDLGVVANMADDVLVMYRGKIVERGPVEAIFREGQHPYLKALLHAVPRFDMKPGERLVPLRAVPRAPLPAGVPEKPQHAGGFALKVQGVSKSFTSRGGWFGAGRTTTHALTNVSLTVPRGGTLGLVGESGSGKTTLSKIILHALKPDVGHVLYDDGTGARDVAALEGEALRAYRRSVQFVFQDPFSSLNPRMTAFEILSEPLRVHKVCGEDEIFERVKDLTLRVGLKVEQLRRYPHAFSGGQRQRLGLARALALRPTVLLCDEPTSALDVSVQAQVLNLLQDLQAEMDLSILFVSHNLAVVDYMANRIAVMCRGHIVEEAPRDVLFRGPRHPYTQALLAAVPDPNLDRPLDFSKITGEFSNPARWPDPFTLRPDGPPPAMVEVEKDHFVRFSGAAAAPGLAA